MRYSFMVLLCLCLSLSQMGATWAQTENPYAILIVGNGGHAEMQRQEQVLIQQMAKTLRQREPGKKLPIFSYHFEKQRERAYCEKNLNVLAEDLLFVGIVRLENRVPRKVVYRIDRINNPARAAKDVLQRAEELEAELSPAPAPDASKTPQVSTTPQPQETPTVSPAPKNESQLAPGWRIQLGSFSQLKYAEEQSAELEGIGYEASINRANDFGNSLFKVTVGPFENKEAAAKALDELKQKGFEQAFLVEIQASGDGE